MLQSFNYKQTQKLLVIRPWFTSDKCVRNEWHIAPYLRCFKRKNELKKREAACPDHFRPVQTHQDTPARVERMPLWDLAGPSLSLCSSFVGGQWWTKCGGASHPAALYTEWKKGSFPVLLFPVLFVWCVGNYLWLTKVAILNSNGHCKEIKGLVSWYEPSIANFMN